jgi:hypothetical protein
MSISIRGVIMKIEPIDTRQILQSKIKKKIIEKTNDTNDTVEISEAAKSKYKRLQFFGERVRSGYYLQDEILDELAEKIIQVLL